MGKALQVRLYAYTYSEADVRAAWPALWRVAFEENRPGFPLEMQGVLELVRALHDLHQFHSLPKALGDLLAAHLPGIVQDVNDLERHLADWNPDRARQATERIEDGLDSLEKLVGNL